MATIAQVRDRAANDLGMLRLGQSLQHQDSTRITAGYNEVYQQLKTDGLATWTSTADIPEALVPYVVSLVADNCLNTYSTSPDRYARIKSAALMAPKEIAKLVTNYHTSQDSPTDY
jgi:hypothetical protein